MADSKVRFLPIPFNLSQSFLQQYIGLVSFVIRDQKLALFLYFCHQVSSSGNLRTQACQMKAIVALFIDISYLQTSMIEEPLYCCHLSKVACPMQSRMPITILCIGIVIRMSNECLQSLNISICCRSDESGISKEVACLNLRVGQQSPKCFLFLSENGDHQRRVSFIIPFLEIKLMIVSLDEIKDDLFLGLIKGQHQYIILLSKLRRTLHDGSESLKVTLNDSLLEFIKTVRDNLIDDPLGKAQQQQFSH